MDFANDGLYVQLNYGLYKENIQKTTCKKLPWEHAIKSNYQ